MSAQDSIRVKHARGPWSEGGLTKLIEQHVVVRNGAGRNVSFTQGPEATLFSQPPQLRKDVPYDLSRIGDYHANVTRWLRETAEQRMRLAASAVNHKLDASTYSRQIAERFLIDLSWASSAMEGNTYDYLDTEALIKFGAEAEGHEVVEATMILNHKCALDHAFSTNPERFVKRPPQPPAKPVAVWINPPQTNLEPPSLN